MKRVVVGLLILSTCVMATQYCVAQSGWVWQNPRPQGAHLRDIVAVDENILVAVGDGACVLRSTDAGETWQNQSIDGGTDLYGVSFPDNQTGYAVGRNGSIFKSDDAGRTWRRVLNPPVENVYLSDIAFIDASTGVAVGQDIDGVPYSLCFRTTDGGLTWDRKSPFSSPHNFIEAAVVFIDNAVGYIAGSNGLYRSSDRGNSWTFLSNVSQKGLTAIRFANRNLGFAVGDNGVLRTTDGGQSWIELNTGIGARFRGIDFIDANTWLAVGRDARTGLTTDRGETWSRVEIETSLTLCGVTFTSRGSTTTGWVVGYLGTILRSTDLGESWQSRNKGVMQHLNSVSFSPQGGGIIGTAVGNTILHTTNGGTDWEEQLVDNLEVLSGVCFIDTSLGVAVGGSGYIIRTMDGGRTWTTQESGADVPLNSVSLVDEEVGTIVGSVGTILRTTDGGRSWSKQSSGTQDGLHSVSFTSRDTGTAVGGYNILRTTDGGASWMAQASPAGKFLYAVHFSDADNGTAVGVAGTIIHTTNGGETWVRQTSGTGEELRGVFFTDPLNGTVVGWQGKILRTTDGGGHWINQTRLTSLNLYGVHFSDVNTGTAVGNAGIILKTTDGGTTWVEDSEPQPREMLLEQNYPNPFRPTTTIRYTLQKPQHVVVLVTDLYGREVRRVIDGTFKETGSHQVQFDAAGLPSGVYLYTLLADGQRQTRKMVLMR